MIAHPQWQTLSATIASRTVANPGRKILTSQFHLSNHQKKQNQLSWGSKQGGQGGMSTLGFPIGNTPTHCYSPGGGPGEKASPTNLHIPSPILPQDSTGQLPATFEDEVQNEKFKVVNENS